MATELIFISRVRPLRSAFWKISISYGGPESKITGSATAGKEKAKITKRQNNMAAAAFVFILSPGEIEDGKGILLRIKFFKNFLKQFLQVSKAL